MKRKMSAAVFHTCAIACIVFLCIATYKPEHNFYSEKLSNTKTENTSRYMNLRSMKTEFKSRKTKAFQVCKKYKVFSSQSEFKIALSSNSTNITFEDWVYLKKINPGLMFYAPKSKFVYCKVTKSGSTNWAYYLLKLAGLPDSEIETEIGIHKLLRNYYPKIRGKKLSATLKSNLSFMIARQPFERILSAYRDKLENYKRDLKFRGGFYHKYYGSHIVSHYRDPNDKTLLNRVEPTWKEFVKYIIDTPVENLDQHWRPIYTLCSPCSNKFDIILKMENFNEETLYTLHTLSLEDTLKPKWIHKNKNKTSELIKFYFQQLSKEDINNLYDKYKLDFELFDYSFKEYEEKQLTSGVN